MSSMKRRAIGATLVAVLVATCPTTVGAQDGIRQYKAAVTRIFLWRYSALPIFRRNPIFPGSVVRLSDEAIYLAPERCYAQPQAGQYRKIGDYTEGMRIAASADLRVKGQVLSKYLAEIEAGTGARIVAETRITVTPLSLDSFKPDAASLRKIKSSSECGVILELLDGRKGGYVVAAEVLHGALQYRVQLALASSVDVAARSKIVAQITRVFGIREAEIATTGTTVSFAVAASPDPQTLAIVPERLNLEELARITHYLQGKRGTALETAVDEALTATEAGVYQRAVNAIRNVLSDDIKRKEEWAENFVSGKELISIRELRSDYGEKVDFRKVATYAAAKELTR